jgi:hypothetical protein
MQHVPGGGGGTKSTKDKAAVRRRQLQSSYGENKDNTTSQGESVLLAVPPSNWEGACGRLLR